MKGDPFPMTFYGSDVEPRSSESDGRWSGGAEANSVSTYASRLKRHRPISREREHDLAVRHTENNDAKAGELLLTSNLRLVVKIAREYRHSHVSIDDLIQEGNLGLVMALRKYDPYRGVKLSTYAAWWIRAYVLKHILDNSRLVRWGTTQAQRKLFFALRKQQQKLAAQGIEPSPALLAEMLHVSEREVVEMDMRLAQPELSVDAPIRALDDSTRSLLDRLETPAEGPDTLVQRHELSSRLDGALGRFRTTLTPRDTDILEERILSEAPDTLEQIGSRYGISRERARQLEERLKKKLYAFLAVEFQEPKLSDGPDPEEDLPERARESYVA
jgi:RNA polymerase sigma-32 factor